MPSVSNLFRPGGQRWAPDADSVNAPDGVLLRADNLVPDVGGTLSLRRGSEIQATLAVAGDVHSLHTVELADGTTYRSRGVDDSLFINNILQGTFDGSGDIAIGDDSYQVFFARGTTKKKWDGTTYNNWGIAAPTIAPELAAVSAITSTVADFNTGESPALAALEGTLALTSDYAAAANQAQTLTPDASLSRGTLHKLWTSDQNFFSIAGVEGSESDLFDVYLKISDTRNIESIEVHFGVGDSSTVPFLTDRFEFKFDLTKTKSIPLKDFDSEGYGSYGQAVTKALSAIRPEDITGIKTPEQVKLILQSVGGVPSPTSAIPVDSTTWGHLTVSRGQFKRVGSTAARGWDTVRGFKIIVNCRKGTAPTVTFADAIWIGGGARSLTGEYRCVYQAVRNFGPYYELSPPSPPSDPINLNHQALQITIDGGDLITLDPQTDVLWIYLFGGWLDQYYRFAVVPARVNTGMTIDELTTPAGSDLNAVSRRARITTWGYTYSQLNGGGVPSVAASTDLSVTLRTSELEALVENYKLDPYLTGPPDEIIGIAGPWNNRMFTLTSEGYVYPSSNRSPSIFNSLHVIDLTRYGNPLWITRTGNGVYVGMEKDVVYMAGSGDNTTDAAVDIYPQPLNVGNPPIDAAHWVDGNSIMYRSCDGPVVLTGGSLQPIPFQGTSLLWRGQDRHGVPAINTTTGRFRIAVDAYIMYMLIPEGSDTSGNIIYRYSQNEQQWSRLVFAEVDEFWSIYNEPDGTLVAGDNAGRVWTLEVGDQDNSTDISIYLLTPIGDGGQPLAYKDADDFQMQCDTDGDTLTARLFKDGALTASESYSVRTTADGGVFRGGAEGVGRFLRAQMDLSGTCSGFVLYSYNLTYRTRPQHMMVLDTGYFTPEEPADLLWLYEVEFDAICAADVTMTLYVNDTLKYSTPVGVTAFNVRDVHQIPLPRGTKGERIRLVFTTSNADGEGFQGFDPYSVRVRASSSGNQHERKYLKVYPAGNAP